MRNNLVVLFLFIFSLFFPQKKFLYRKVDPNLLSKISATDVIRKQIQNQYFAGAKDLTSYLPLKYDRSGKTDYTKELQKGLDENKLVIFPNFPVLIAPQGLQLRSNSKVLFLKNSQLKIIPNDKEFYSAINFEGVENVSVYFANLLGEKDQHQSSKGEWGMGIYILHSKNLLIEKPVIKKFWGDGVYVGKLDGINSENIIINGALIDESRRNGISIVSGKNIEIKNSIIANTYGTSPEYGIDVEPNKPEDDLENIVFTNVTTFNNFKGGFLFALDNLQGKKTNPISIILNNFSDFYSTKGIEFHIDRGYQKYFNPLRGSIVINGANLNYNENSIVTNESKPAQIDLKFKNLKNNKINVGVSKIETFKQKFQQGKLNAIK